MIQLVVDGLSWLCLAAGGFFLIVGAIGILRFPDFFSRLHALGVCDSMGSGLILLGLMLQGGFTLVTVKLILIFYFVIFTGPTAIHALAAAAQTAGLRPAGKDREQAPSNT
ncbi:MAG: monovalent cation/H(+) antiporter subunit G [Gammaproteobacteria bacterium]|jgi:multicomponent Na+:H+ antiporter subunit G